MHRVRRLHVIAITQSHYHTVMDLHGSSMALPWHYPPWDYPPAWHCDEDPRYRHGTVTRAHDSVMKVHDNCHATRHGHAMVKPW